MNASQTWICREVIYLLTYSQRALPCISRASCVAILLVQHKACKRDVSAF